MVQLQESSSLVKFGGRQEENMAPPPPGKDLHKARPVSPELLGQAWWRKLQNQTGAPNRRFGFERLGHMFSVGIPFKFVELQGRHPFDFVQETKEHFKEPPRPTEKSHQVAIEDLTLLPVTEWMEPIRKGQAYWDYCRDKYMTSTSQLGAALAPCCSMYSMWTITDNCLQNGGWAFMLAYLIITILFTIPIIYIELAIGQFHRLGLAQTMKHVCPLLLGLGYLMLTLCVFDYLLSLTRLSYLLFYIVSSMRATFPWKTCDNPWNSKYCRENFTIHEGDAGGRNPAVEFFKSYVQKHIPSENGTRREGIYNFSVCPNLGLLVCFICLLIIFHYTSRARVEQLGRRMYFTFQFASFLVLFCFLLRGYVSPYLENKKVMTTTYEWFTNPDHYNYLVEKNVSFELTAFKHAIISSGVGTGIHITSGSHNSFVNRHIKFYAVMTGLIGYLLHCAIAAFFIICHFTLKATDSLAYEEGVHGNDSFFEIFPQYVAHYHPARGRMWMMFNAMIGGILLFGMLRATCSLHTIQQHFCDHDKHYYEPIRTNFNFWESQRGFRQKRQTLWTMSSQRKAFLMAKVILVLGLVQLISFSPRGETYFLIAKNSWYKYVPALVILVECCVFFFFLGVRTLNAYVRKMTTWQVTLWYRFVWKSITPIFPVLYFIHSEPWIVVEDNEETHLDYYSYAVTIGFRLLLLFIQVIGVLIFSPCARLMDNLRLAATPEHDHYDAIQGIRPLTRFHWMHHVAVPSGIGRRAHQEMHGMQTETGELQSGLFDKALWSCIWNTLGFKCLNDGDCCQTSKAVPNDAPTRLFPAEPVKLKSGKKVDAPDYFPNKQILTLLEMKREPVKQYRKKWITDKVDVEKKKGKAAEKNNEKQPPSKRPLSSNDDGMETSSSEETSTDHSCTSDCPDVELLSDYDMSPYEESFDDDESEDWADFSDSSLNSVDSEEREKRKSENPSDVDQSYEKRWRLDHFPDYTVDELEEFSEIMDEIDEPDHHTPFDWDHFTDETSETDTDTDTDSKGSGKRGARIGKGKVHGEDDVILSDPQLAKESDQKKQDRDASVNTKDGEDQDDKESVSSCNSSCSSENSSWSDRGAGAPPLAEEPALIVRKPRTTSMASSAHGKLAADRVQLTRKKKPTSNYDTVSLRSTLAIQGIRETSESTGKGFFTDVKQRLKNFLSVNVTARHETRNTLKSSGSHDSILDEDE